MMKSFGVVALFLKAMPALAMAMSASNTTHGEAHGMKNNSMPKLDTILNRFYAEFEESGRRLMKFKPPAPMLMTPSGNAIVEVVGKGTTAELRSAMQYMALEVTGCFSLVEGACSVIVPVSQFGMLSENAQVQSVTSNLVQTQASGSVSSQASESMFADEARRIFNVDGHGTKVCVLSDSFNCVAASGGFTVTTAEEDVRLGDLPSFDRMDIVRDLADEGCTDEGRAMMQLIHDVAPGADLAFYTAFLGLAGFAEGIVELVHIGCDVIVDDIIYFAEAMYQDDLVAQAANYANDMGVPYFSAAGNFARGSWEGPWKEGFGPFGPTLDFTDGEGGEALSLQVRANRDSTIILQWSDPTAYASGLPGPKTDLDLYLEIDGDLAGFSIDANQYRPLEFVFLDEGNTYDIFIERFSGPPPEFIKMIFFGDVERVSSNGDPRTISAGTTFGHANAEGVIGVGAAAYINTPGFGVSPAIPERYTAAGGVPILFDLQGERLDKEQVRQTPAFTAPDGTCTNFFGGLDVFDTGVSACYNFFGTSAAAPNAAAVAALMLQVQPRLQPDDIRGILVRTAEDMDDPSTAWFDHGFDLTTGSGFLNALYAVGETALPLSECKHGKGKRDGKGGKGGKGERRNLSEVVDGVKNRRRLDTSKESTFDLTKLPRSYHEVDPRRGRALERRSSQTAREEPEDGVSSKKTIRGA